jgi:Outer membrane protein beta-barrel domain
MAARLRSTRIAVVAATLMLTSSIAFAQASPHRGSVEIGGGLAFSNGFDLGSQAALETRNSTTDPSGVPLFQSSTVLDSAPGGQVRLGVYVTPAFAIEGGLLLTKPSVKTSVSGDFEQAANVTASETISHYVIDGSAVYHFRSFAGGKGVPFLLGGAGYLRDVHEGGLLVDTGSEFHGGGGFKYWFGSGKHHLGLRGDLGFSSRDGGFDFKDGRRTVPYGGVSLAFLF